MAGVNHDAGEPLINAVLAQFKGVAVVQVQGGRHGRAGMRWRSWPSATIAPRSPSLSVAFWIFAELMFPGRSSFTSNGTCTPSTGQCSYPQSSVT